MTQKIKLTSARRVAVFSTLQTFVQVQGEWVLKDPSCPSVAAIANRFFQENNVVPVFVSPPEIRTVRYTSDPPEWAVHVALSVLYEPAEAVIDESQIAQAESDQFPEIDVRLFHQAGKSVRDLPIRRVDEGFRFVRISDNPLSHGRSPSADSLPDE